MPGGMGVRKNVYIEEWAGRRENLEHVFKYTRGAWARLAIFGFAVPLGFYHLIATEMASDNSEYVKNGPRNFGYDYKFLGGYSNIAKKGEDKAEE